MEQTVAWMRMAALVHCRAQRKERKLMAVWWIVSKEAKKEAFRKYLEFSGVIDSLTKGIVSFCTLHHY
ncbi:BnaC07g49100D [Brassica napus]|uniref:BnaC07g49100D protein n=1 Tax=Brassica napus TaxID=3708 RepID=A0A078IR99_BRANA|nr:BnaC07g49100D [Brassica napus]